MFPVVKPMRSIPVVVVFLVCPAVLENAHENIIGVRGWKI